MANGVIMEQFSGRGVKLKSLALALSLSFSWGVEAQTLEFKNCVEKTLNQNPEMSVSAARIEQAQSALNAATNSRLPQITASFTASNSDNPLNVFGMKLQQRQATFGDFGIAEFPFSDPASSTNIKPDALNKPGSHSDFNTRLEMLIPVYNGGKISSYQEQAKAMIKAAEHGDVAVKQFLTFNVYQAYEAVHTARAYIDVAEKAVLASNSYVKTTKNLVDQGILVRSELLNAQVNQSNALMALEKAKNSEEVALESLKMLMALEPGTQIDVGHRVDISLPVDNMEKLIDMALASNPQMQARRNEVNSSFAAVGVSKAALYPSFNLMARQDWNDDQVGLNNSSYTVAGVVSWKITDFGVTSSGVDKANATAKMKQSELRSKENQLRLEVVKAWHALNIDKKQVHVNQLAAEQAEEAQRLVLKRYKNGVATITEVLAGQALLDKARAEVVAATYDRNIQAAKLRLNTGTMSLSQL